MKKYTAILAAIILALTGCSSEQSRGGSVTSDAPLSAVNSVPDIAEVPAVTEIAIEQLLPPDEPRTEPPQLQVIYSGDGLATCAAMTLGTYTWDTGDSIVCADSIGAVACAAEGLIGAVVDLDTVAENEPKINLWGGAEMTGARLFALEGGDIAELEFTSDGVISFPQNVYDGVVCVSAKFPEGEADYFFMVKRSLTDPTSPPQLRIISGEIGFSMTKGGYDWTYTEGNETVNTVTDISSPWEMYRSGHVKPELSALPGEVFTVMLPEGGEITGAQYWTSASEVHPLEYSGKGITMPQQELSAVCTVTVEMQAGTCEYIFAVNIGEIASSPAYEP